MIKRRRILHADKIIQNVIHVFCLLMFLQLKGFYAQISNPLLLYSTTHEIRAVNIESLDFTKPKKVSTIVKDLEQSTAVDFLYRRNLVCWSDQVAVIQCASYNGSYTGDKMRIVSYGLITPSGIAIDWYTEKIYWTDGETNKIEVISIDNKHRKVLFWTEVDLARAIVVVPKYGLMFWTDWGEVPKIERANMDGDPESRKTIVTDDIYWPNGLTVDYANNLLYWVDAKILFLDSMDFEGKNRKRVIRDGLTYPYALTFFHNRLFWTDWTIWEIYTYDKNTSAISIVEISSLQNTTKEAPIDIRVLDPSQQLTPENYPCKVNNGGCSHLCLLSPEIPGYKCACPTGVKLVEGSNSTCKDGPQSLLLVAQRLTISKVSLDCADYTPFTLPLKDIKRAITVDFDPKHGFVYWADNVAKSISRARLDGSYQSSIIHTGLGVPDTIAIDPSARNIYWTDPVADTISVARLDGDHKKVIVHGDLYEPRALALHPAKGLMFWSDWSEKRPKIEWAHLDGSERQILVADRLLWPNGITLDTKEDKLYWGDARTHKVEVCNLDGSNRRELQNIDIMHIFGVTLLGNHLYWTDMQKRTLERINRFTGGERQSLIEQMANMMGVKAFHLQEKIPQTPCSINNGNCSHLCFNKPTHYVCSCPLGLELGKDKRTCIEPEAFLVYGRKNVIGRVSVENENNSAVLPLKDILEVSAIATHVSGQKIYWSDNKMKAISRCSINADNVEKVLESTGNVEGLAVDWSGQNIYWTEAVTQRIEVSRLDGSSRRSLIWQGLKKPMRIVLDPKKGYMYWSEIGSKTIKRAGMDGSNPTVLLDKVGRVNSLAIDYEKRCIYWAATDPSAIEYAHLDGTNRKAILGNNIPFPYALTLYMDRVYWGDFSTGNIEVAQKSDGSNRHKIQDKLDWLSDLKVFHKSRHLGGNQCSVDNGGCSHLCLAMPSNERPSDYRCSCPTHYKLNKDNLTCTEPEEFLLYAQKSSIGRVMVTPGECNDAVIPVTGLKNVKAIEYDPISRYLYWMDDDTHSLRRIPMSYSMTPTTEATTVVKDISRPFYMVLDVLGRAIYWTCCDRDSINVTSVSNNSTIWVMIKGDKMIPRHLALHQTKRLLVWHDVGLNAIMRANVDGTECTEVTKADNTTALTVDQTTGLVYWSQNRQIHVIDIDGTKKRIVWQGSLSYTLGAYSGSLYWSATGGALMRLPLNRREAPALAVQHISKVTALTVVYKVSRSHPCMDGGGCGSLPGSCVSTGCVCGVNCAPQIYSTAITCPPLHMRCMGQDHKPLCVPLNWRCDGHADCADGADEVDSGEGGEGGCGACAGGVVCAEGGCGTGLNDCTAGAICHKPMPHAFRCDDHLCLASHLLCDGHAHCQDGTDEAPGECDYANKQEVSSASGQSRVLVWCGAAAAVLGVGLLLLAARRVYAHKNPIPRSHTAPTSIAAIAAPLYTHKHRDTPLGESATSGSETISLYRYSGTGPPVNPPPSPATAVTVSSLVPRRRAYRHYRAVNRPPPPTPASTDSDTHRAPSPPPPSPAQ